MLFRNQPIAIGTARREVRAGVRESALFARRLNGQLARKDIPWPLDVWVAHAGFVFDGERNAAAPRASRALSYLGDLRALETALAMPLNRGGLNRWHRRFVGD